MLTDKRIAYLARWHKENGGYYHAYYLKNTAKKNRQSSDWSKNNPEARRRIVKRTKAIIRAEYRSLIDSIKNRPCADCHGWFDRVCMDFDHKDMTLKQWDIATMCGFPKAKILKEVNKCDVVCANCHRIRTGKQLNYYQ